MRAKSFRIGLALAGLALAAADVAVAFPGQAAAQVAGTTVVNAPPRTTVLAAGPTKSANVFTRGRATDDRGVSRVKVTVKDRATGRYWNPVRQRWQPRWLWYDAALRRPGRPVTRWVFRFDPTGSGGSGRYQVAAVAWDVRGRRDPRVARRRFTVAPSPAATPPVDEPVEPSDPVPPGDEMSLVWNDEFDGTALDPHRWKTFSGLYNAPPMYQDYTGRPENVRVENGHLVLEAHREASGGQQYTSGMVVSNDLRDAANSRHRGNTGWTHGRFEMRARLPDVPGLWPAFWMRPEDVVYGSWPRSGEIDIVEYPGPTPRSWNDRRLVHGLHWWSDDAPDDHGSVDRHGPVTAAWLDRFHTFAVEWDATGFRWFVDGVQTEEASTLWSAPGAPAPAPFDQDFFLTLNLQVGGWAGAVHDAALPETFEVDWVRVYQ